MAKKILVVDDEPDLLKVILIRLETLGYEAHGGTDGKQALALARKIVPDLIILDIYLPFINGDEVARILKKDKSMKHIPILMISATTKTLSQRTLDNGAEDFLAKPFEPKELIKKISKLIG